MHRRIHTSPLSRIRIVNMLVDTITLLIVDFLAVTQGGYIMKP